MEGIKDLDLKFSSVTPSSILFCMILSLGALSYAGMYLLGAWPFAGPSIPKQKRNINFV